MTYPDSSTAQLSARDTHPIVLAKSSRVVLESDGLGWRNIHASVTSQRRWSGALKPIEHICFAYCLRQTARIERRLQGEDEPSVFTLGPRQFGILPTHVTSAFSLTGAADIMMIYLRGSLVGRMARELFGDQPQQITLAPRVGISDPLLEQLAREVVAALDRRDAAGDGCYVDQLAAMAASHLLRHHWHRRAVSVAERDRPFPPSSAHAGSLHRVRKQIEGMLDRDISVEAMAREAALSTAHFGRVFAAAFGETPHQYLIKRRIERAQQLLAGTGLSIAEIALQTGFSSQSHFSDAFRRAIGISPRRYRLA